jgi:CRP-like cAMP-binding protein
MRSTNTLREVAILAGVQAEDRLRIERLCTFRSFLRGKMIIDARDASREVFFLLKGRARVIRYSAAGRPVSYHEVLPGGVFGEYAAIDGGARSTGVEALEVSRVAAMTAGDFRAVLHAAPRVMEAVLVQAIGQARCLTERIFEFSTLDVNDRIVAEVVRLAKSAIVVGRRARICPFPKHGEIASRISTHREAVARQLKLLERLKLITRIGTTLVVNDLAALERMVRKAGGE